MGSWAWLKLLADLNEVVTLPDVGSAEMTLLSKLDVSVSARMTKHIKLLNCNCNCNNSQTCAASFGR